MYLLPSYQNSYLRNGIGLFHVKWNDVAIEAVKVGLE